MCSNFQPTELEVGMGMAVHSQKVVSVNKTGYGAYGVHTCGGSLEEFLLLEEEGSKIPWMDEVVKNMFC